VRKVMGWRGRAAGDISGASCFIVLTLNLCKHFLSSIKKLSEGW
jgi:hypothetical protein